MKVIIPILLLTLGLIGCSNDGRGVDASNPNKLELIRMYNEYGDTLYIVTDKYSRKYMMHLLSGGHFYESKIYSKADSVYNAWLRRDILAYKKEMRDYERIK